MPLPLPPLLSQSTAWLHNKGDERVCSAFTELWDDGSYPHSNWSALARTSILSLTVEACYLDPEGWSQKLNWWCMIFKWHTCIHTCIHKCGLTFSFDGLGGYKQTLFNSWMLFWLPQGVWDLDPGSKPTVKQACFVLLYFGSSSLRSLAYSVLGRIILAGLSSEATDGEFCDVVGLRLWIQSHPSLWWEWSLLSVIQSLL